MHLEKIYHSDKLYSLAARFYDILSRLNGYKKAADYFVERLPFTKKDQINALDAGCGTGLYTLALLKRYPNAFITAFDLNRAMVETLRRSLVKNRMENQVRPFVASVLDPLEEIHGETFNLIVTGGVLEYTPVGETVRNLRRFLAPGGYFLNAPVRDTRAARFFARMYGFKPYSREQNIATFERYGLVLEKIVTLPRYSRASLIKEAHLFKKPNAPLKPEALD